MNAVHVMPPLQSQQETVAIAIIFLGQLGKFQLSFYEVGSRRNYFVIGLLSKPVFSFHAGIASAVEAGLCAETVKLADKIVSRIHELNSMQAQVFAVSELAADVARKNQQQELAFKRLKRRERINWWVSAGWWLVCGVVIFWSLFF